MKRHNNLFDFEPPRSGLLSKLWEYQLRDSFISNQAIRDLASLYDLSEIEIKGVATFYHFFHTQPAGRHTIYINNSMVAELNGYERIREALERETGARLNTTDPAGTFGLFPTPCIGLCDQEPSVLIDFHPFTKLNVLKAKDIINKLKSGKTVEEIEGLPTDHICYTPGNDRTIFFAPYMRGDAIGQLSRLSGAEVIECVRISELSGRGGAFFPTWKKWEACRSHQGTMKFVVCNADEGEPGTFKDRVLLNSQAGSVLEGMIIAGYAVGANYGFIYLRGEYRWLLKKLQNEIDLFREQGFLGKEVAGIKDFDFDIRIECGAGAYVCGEETAMLESMEGKRGEPRTKWFYTAEKGYLQMPTVVNNVETFAAVARLFQMGTNEYMKRGIAGSHGTKLISVSGDCKMPGLYEIEWGMTVSELLELCGAENPFYIQLSGPSGECISTNEKYKRISMRESFSHQEIRCGGSFMIFNNQRDLVNILMNFSEFFKHESCGVCTPCRAGNFIIQRKLEHIKNGLADMDDLNELESWGTIMRSSSRCGLGKTAPNSILFALDKFRDYFTDRMSGADNSTYRKFDLRSAVEDYDRYKP